MEIRVGTRVKPNPQHEDYTKFERQHKGNEGIVQRISDYGDEYTVEVQWSHGRTARYKREMLIPLEEETINDLNKIRKGMRVKPNPEHEDYDKFKHQHEGNEGTVLEINRGTPLGVRVGWDNRNKNVYRSAMLIPVEYDYTEEAGTQNSAFTESGKDMHGTRGVTSYDLPPLPGQRVCLNPEDEDFSNLLNKIGDTVGYIINPMLTDNDLKKWKAYDAGIRKSIMMQVRFDNGQKVKIKVRSMLPIDAPCKTVNFYRFSDYSERYIIEGTEQEYMDGMIIKNGFTTQVIKTYDDAWREEILNHVKSS